MNRILPTPGVTSSVSTNSHHHRIGRSAFLLWASSMAMVGVLAVLALPTTGKTESAELPNQVQRQARERHGM